MHAFKLKHPVPDLQPIGSVSLLGATPTALPVGIVLMLIVLFVIKMINPMPVEKTTE